MSAGDKFGRTSEVIDVAVAGGGPTGLWLACELALAGVRVVIGRVICLAVRATVTWPRWWRAIRVLPCW
jgi:NADH dehydrogenase FAD-containing subunit